MIRRKRAKNSRSRLPPQDGFNLPLTQIDHCKEPITRSLYLSYLYKPYETTFAQSFYTWNLDTILFLIEASKFCTCRISRGGSRGRVQGVRTPTPPNPPEMTCGFLIQLVFCKKKKLFGLLVLK